MPVPLAFVDTETTGVHPGRRAWEVAIIRREPDGETKEWLAQVTDVDLSDADPFGLKVGRFYERHTHYAPGGGRSGELLIEIDVAVEVERLTRGAHLVGAVPNFDAEVFADMLRRHKLTPAWHYHLIDVEALAVGYLNAMRVAGQIPRRWVVGVGLLDQEIPDAAPTPEPVPLPWKSDDLSLALGVDLPGEDERHTALGDARWAQRIYDKVIGA